MKKSNFNNLWVFPLLYTSISIELESCDIKFKFYLNHPQLLIFTQSKDRKDNTDYPAAKQYANVSLGLIITNIAYVLCSAVLAVGLSLGIYYRAVYGNYYNCKYPTPSAWHKNLLVLLFTLARVLMNTLGVWIKPATWLHSVHKIAVPNSRSPQHMLPGIGQNTTYAVSDFT